MVVRHRRATADGDLVTNLSLKLRRGSPELFIAGIHQHIRITGGAHGLDDLARKSARRIIGGNGKMQRQNNTNEQ